MSRLYWGKGRKTTVSFGSWFYLPQVLEVLGPGAGGGGGGTDWHLLGEISLHVFEHNTAQQFHLSSWAFGTTRVKLISIQLTLWYYFAVVVLFQKLYIQIQH